MIALMYIGAYGLMIGVTFGIADRMFGDDDPDGIGMLFIGIGWPIGLPCMIGWQISRSISLSHDEVDP